MSAGVITSVSSFKSLKSLDLTECTKEEIKAFFENSYDLDEVLFSSLKDESVFFKHPDALRLPLIFYYGHTAVVYINKLVLGGLLEPEERVNFKFEELFETGVDEMSWDDVEHCRMGGNFKWPEVEEVAEYRRQVKRRVLKLIDDTPLELPITMDSPWWALLLGMDHERIHIETSSVLIRQLPVAMVTKPESLVYGPRTCGNGVEDNPPVRSGGVEVTFGKPKNFPSFGWDNEYGTVTHWVPEFEASRHLITNREFLSFVKAGGYASRSLWSEEGWKWRSFRKAEHPTFWVCQQGCKSGCGGDIGSYSHCRPSMSNGLKEETNGEEGSNYKLRCVFDVVDMPWDWPVEVNYLEAKAYCAWRGPEFRLPTEAEHHVMRGTQISQTEGTKCDINFQDDPKANVNFKYASSTPVNMYPPTDAGFHDVFGNVWEWVEDHMNGLPGFESHHLYDDFTTPTFDGEHNLIMGGSWASTGDESSRFARYAFRRHFFQHLGFRLARSVKDSAGAPLPCTLLLDTTVFVPGHGSKDSIPNLDRSRYSLKSVKSSNTQLEDDSYAALLSAIEEEYNTNKVSQEMEIYKAAIARHGVSTDKALHIGCGTGRASFELTKIFGEVIAQDCCGRFIDTCAKLKKSHSAKVNGLQLAIHNYIDTSKVTFKQFTWIPNEVGKADFALFSGVDRVMNPKAWFARFREVVRKDGLLAVTSKTCWDAPKILEYIGKSFKTVDSAKLQSGTVITFFCRH